MLSFDEKKEGIEGVTRREFLRISGNVGKVAAVSAVLYKTGLLASVLGLSGCTGAFGVVRYNNAPDYDSYHSNADIKNICVAYLNAADLRGNTTNIWQIVSGSKIRRRARWLANEVKKMGIDVLCLSEVDYKDTAKTGYINQPQTIARYMGTPYDYVVFDQYMKSAGWTTGNAVISRFPMKPIHRHIYDRKWWIFGRFRHCYKDFIHTGMKVGKRKLDTIVNHFDDGFLSVRMDEARYFMKYVRKLYKKDPKRFIVAPGDYNSQHDSSPIRHILSQGILFPPPKNFGKKSFQAHKPTVDIDHMFASKNLQMSGFDTWEFPWSDHRGIRAELRFRY